MRSDEKKEKCHQTDINANSSARTGGSSIENENKTNKEENMKPLIDFHKITVKKRGHVLLENMSLKIYPGQHVAILGPNGSGKSSLIKVITREYYALSEPGSYAKIMGTDLWNVADLRKKMGIVTTDLQYQCDRSEAVVFDIVLSGFFSSFGIYKNHTVTADMESAALKALQRLGIEHLAHRNVKEISTGEARKVLIARALVHEPKALILDEPTNSLDVRASSEFLKTISELSSNVTIILVTHILKDIIPEIKRIVLIRNGAVFADGQKEKILTSENMTNLFSMPLEIKRENEIYDYKN